MKTLWATSDDSGPSSLDEMLAAKHAEGISHRRQKPVSVEPMSGNIKEEHRYKDASCVETEKKGTLRPDG